MNGISIVVPCLNEEQTLPLVISAAIQGQANSKMPWEIIVADNGSTDSSVRIAQELGARVVHVPAKGYGAALNAGIKNASYRFIVFGDADCSYPLESALRLIEPLQNGNADFVLGSRLNGTIESGAMPLLNRYLGTPILSLILRMFYGLPVSDCNSGMRAMTAETFQKLNLKCQGMEFASEMIVKVAQSKVRYQEVPIHFRKDQRGRAPHLRRWRDGWRHLRLMLAFAPSNWMIIPPFLLTSLLLLGSLLVSLQHVWHPEGELRFHTAFILMGMSLPVAIGLISLILTKVSLVKIGNTADPLLQFILKASDEGWFFFASVASYFLMSAGVLFLFFEWWQTGFGNLFQIGALIPIMMFSLLGTTWATLDIGIGAINLIPKTE